MPRTLFAALILAAVLVGARAAACVVPGVRFDADQAIVGLMAKHISEGRAFPVFFYGQSYLPALESYLAAPLMLVAGPTEPMLKLPVLLMNVAAGTLVVWTLARDGGLGPWLALVAALPLLLPSALVSTRMMEAMGGNVESFLYIPLLWVLRDRRWAFAVVLGLAAAQREFAFYGAAALLLLELRRGRLWTPASIRHWASAAVGVVAARALLEALRPFAPMFGPGTIARESVTDIQFATLVGAQFCADPTRWPSRLGDLLHQHLPLAFGGAPGPLADFAVNTAVLQGTPGLHLWVGATTVVALAVAAAITVRREPLPLPPAAPAVPGGEAGAYYLLTGLASLAVYWLIACSRVTVESFRYDLLVVLVPVGALALGLRAARGVPLQAGLAAAAVLAAVLNLADMTALGTEVLEDRRPDHRRQAARVLEARGIQVLWGEFRIAYPISFFTQERVRVAATGFHKIDAYAEEAKAAGARVIQTVPCPGGEEIAPGVHLCPPAP